MWRKSSTFPAHAAVKTSVIKGVECLHVSTRANPTRLRTLHLYDTTVSIAGRLMMTLHGFFTSQTRQKRSHIRSIQPDRHEATGQRLPNAKHIHVHDIEHNHGKTSRMPDGCHAYQRTKKRSKVHDRMIRKERAQHILLIHQDPSGMNSEAVELRPRHTSARSCRICRLKHPKHTQKHSSRKN